MDALTNCSTMIYDVIVVGAGQSGLALGYYLHRSDLNYLILDAEQKAGGSWQHYWTSLRLFSPAQWSSLPGMMMPGGTTYYPSQQEVVDYFSQYEEKYQLRIKRPVRVKSVSFEDDQYMVKTDQGIFQSKTLVSATGSFQKPWIPEIAGLDLFAGEVIHSSQYREPSVFQGMRVGIVGEGNSGAQLLAELSEHCQTFWFTKNTPEFLPDEVDGKYLFDAATQMYNAKRMGREFVPPSLGHIVMVPSVLAARSRGVLAHYSSIVKIDNDRVLLESGEEMTLDALIFCTGYRNAIDYLSELPVTIRHDKIHTIHTRSRELPSLWMVGYGSWTGFASATIIGVGRTARSTVSEIVEFLQSGNMEKA